MSRAKEIFPESEEGFSFVHDYEPIIRIFGEIVLKVSTKDYQGDSWVILRKNADFGWLRWGWGSCSGCDSLQACSTFEDVDDLIDDLERGILWFGSLDELKSYFREKDWEVEFCSDVNVRDDFIAKALAL